MAVFFVGVAFVAASVFLCVTGAALFLAALACFVLVFSAAFLSAAALAGLVFVDVAAFFLFKAGFAWTIRSAVDLVCAPFGSDFAFEATGLAFVAAALFATGDCVGVVTSTSAMSSPKSLDKSSPPRTFAADEL